MPLARDRHRSRAVAADGGTASSYHLTDTWRHHYRYDAGGYDDFEPLAKRRKSALSFAVNSRSWPQNCKHSGGYGAKFEVPIRQSDSADFGAVCSTRQSEDDDVPVMSRDEIERCSPSRKDGIDRFMETRLRYSYCTYLQSLGTRLDLPQTTVGTAMVLCHRFFLRRSHASNDRFLIATAALFLATKSEETPCLLNSVLGASCEIYLKHNSTFSPQLWHADWFKQWRDRVVEAEQLILTTLNFELDVEHPYIPLTSVLSKLGLSQTILWNLAWNLVNEGDIAAMNKHSFSFVQNCK